ncbi:PTS cellobiose transporter subunit IIC [Tetragenococcus halophilus]|uniref:PTS cellobiose transporter subunit IIC n=1 Tax=Tetragenococcus halophilus TaxID=51669 RepID=UPI000B926E56|nr:PTS cellobiose transporter subunit IIC [Tetragenococcus halophilus]
MNRIMEALENVLMPIADKLNNNRYLNALKNGFLIALPLIIFGSIFVVLANFPFLDQLMSEETFAVYQNTLGAASDATMEIMGLFVVMGIGYKMVEERGGEAIYGAAVALGALLILTPQEAEGIEGVIPTSALGAEGMFLGIITAFVAAELYQYFVKKDFTIKMPQGVPGGVSRSFSSLIPTSLTLTVFLVIRIGFGFTGYETVQTFIYSIIQQPLTALGASLPATLVAVFAIQLFWFFGLHGQIIINSVMDPIWYSLNNDNLAAFQSGEELPHIVTKQFIDTFLVGSGGTGMTLVVVIAILMLAKSRRLRETGKMSLPPAIFNVNEPVIFGLPIVMNPLLFVPWLLTPVVVATATYFAMSVGLVPPPAGVIVPWTTPIFLSGYLAVGNHIMGAVMQLINVVIVIVIWYPFIKMLDRQYFGQE